MNTKIIETFDDNIWIGRYKNTICRSIKAFSICKNKYVNFSMYLGGKYACSGYEINDIPSDLLMYDEIRLKTNVDNFPVKYIIKYDL